MEQTIKGNHIQETFWSLAEFADAANKRSGASHKTYVKNRPEFHHVESMGDAVKLAKLGWAKELPGALEIAESAVEMAEKEHMMDTFSPVWDVAGAEVDVAQYLSGEPECMIDFPLSKTSKQGRVITLVGSVAYSAAISSNTIIRRGRVICALALALGQLGHAVEIWADVANQSNGTGCTMHQRVLVKGANDELDPSQIMFAFANPAMCRALFFGSWDRLPEPFKDAFSRSRSRGRPRPRETADTALFPDGTIYLPELLSGVDVPDADVFLRKYLGDLGLLAE